MKSKYAVRFNNKEQQKLYEKFIKEGYHWKIAEVKILKIYKENGYEY